MGNSSRQFADSFHLLRPEKFLLKLPQVPNITSNARNKLDLAGRIAVSDELKIIAQPLEFIPAEPFTNFIIRLKEVIQEKQIELILVGMPRNMDGTYGPAATRVQEFVSALKAAIPLRIKKWDERKLIASVLREAGFDVVAAAPESVAAATDGACFAAAVVALPGADGSELLPRLRRRQPGLKALLVVEPEALRLVDEDCAILVKRPFDLRELLGCVFALVLREDEHGPVAKHGHAAEFGIAAAKLVCLQNRRVAAAAAGAHRLAQELAHQIGETAALSCGLATVMRPGLAPTG